MVELVSSYLCSLIIEFPLLNHLVIVKTGKREVPIPVTPQSYIKLYMRCWDSNPEMRPPINEINDELANLQKIGWLERIEPTKLESLTPRVPHIEKEFLTDEVSLPGS